MVGPPGYNPEQFGPITDRPVHHAGPSGYVADRPPSYVGPSRYGMNRPTYYAGPSDSTRVHAQTAQVAPYMADPSGYSPGPFGPIADRPVLYNKRSGYETTHAAPYTAGQSEYTFRTIWPGHGPSGLLRRTVRICIHRAESCTIHTVPTFIVATLWCPTNNTL
jgi:hypothetical protein